MRRRLFTIVSALSLLLFAVVLYRWVAGYGDDPEDTRWVLVGGGRVYSACAEDGREWFRIVSGWPEGMVPHSGVVARKDNDEDREVAGFYFESRPLRRWLRGNPGTPTLMHRWTLGVPHWAVAVLTAAAPAGWLYTRVLRPWHRRRTRQGRCPSCGYDLRATPGRCPECGTLSSGKEA